jgi:ketosteroid isomerase-like protein
MDEHSADEIAAVRRAFDRFPRLEEGGGIGLYLEDFHSDVEWVPLMAVLEGRVYRGHEGIKRWIEDLRRDWEVFLPRLEEVRPLGDGHYLLLGHWEARARGSGIDLGETQAASWLIHMRDGKIDRLQTFTIREEALEAADRLRSG